MRSWRPASVDCTSCSVSLSRGGTVAKRGAVRREHDHDGGGRGGEKRGPAPVREDDDARTPSRPSPVALDRIIHERVRLAIVSALAGNDSLSFNDLKELL